MIANDAAVTFGEAMPPSPSGFGYGRDLTGPESDAVLAGLRLLALHGRGWPLGRAFQWVRNGAVMVAEITTNGGDHQGLSHEAIDALANRFHEA